MHRAPNERALGKLTRSTCTGLVPYLLRLPSMAAVLSVDEGYQAVSTAPDAPEPDPTNMGSNEYVLKSEYRQGDTIAGLLAVGAATVRLLSPREYHTD